MNKKIMDVNEVAKYLGFSAKKIYHLAEKRQIPASRVGRQYRFVKKIIDDWLKDIAISSLSDSNTIIIPPKIKKAPSLTKNHTHRKSLSKSRNLAQKKP